MMLKIPSESDRAFSTIRYGLIDAAATLAFSGDRLKSIDLKQVDLARTDLMIRQMLRDFGEPAIHYNNTFAEGAYWELPTSIIAYDNAGIFGFHICFCQRTTTEDSLPEACRGKKQQFNDYIKRTREP